MSVLRPKQSGAATKVISARVPIALHSRLDAVRKRAATANLALDVNALFTQTLERAVRQAEQELGEK